MAELKPMENGPLIAREVPNLKDADGSDIKPDKPAFGLCRCGMSKNKPFCDGTHIEAGFISDKADAKIRNTPIEYSGKVEGKSVTVSYTPVLCGHIAECQRLHKAVFDPGKRPWIQPENGSLEGILAVVAACPSGALRVSVNNEPLHHIDGDESSVQVVKNGPYVVRNIPLGAPFNGAGASEKEYILCRCGYSKNKPFCDGSHHDQKWQDDA